MLMISCREYFAKEYFVRVSVSRAFSIEQCYLVAARAKSRGTPRRRDSSSRLGTGYDANQWLRKTILQCATNVSAARARECVGKQIRGRCTHVTPAGLSKMQKRQRQDPRMIFRMRDEPASCPPHKTLPLCRVFRTGGISNDFPINNVAFLAKRLLRIALAAGSDAEKARQTR